MTQITISLYNADNVSNNSPNKKLFLKKGESFFGLLINEGIFDKGNCNGRGICKNCKVKFLRNAPMPTPAERKNLTPEELRTGIRLACMTKPTKDCQIIPLFSEKAFILSDFINMTKLSPVPEMEMIVTDLGTTSIVMLLLERNSGKVLKTFRAMNPQRKHGNDVVSRLEAGLDGKEKELSDLVRNVLLQGISYLGGKPGYMALSGNTTMIYLLMNYPLTNLSQEPFLETNGEIRTNLGLPLLIMPGISTFVGGDMYANIYAFLKQKKNYGNTLLLDFGTNGEMALLTGEGIFVTAVALGSVFEEIAQMWGTDLINATAHLLQENIIDKYGTMKEPYFSEGFPYGKYCVTQENIRNVQLAKAAIRAGIEILCKQARIAVNSIEEIWLAGAFGHFIDVKSASLVGIIPPGIGDKVSFVGNAALLGTYLYFRDYDTDATNKKIDIKSCNLANIKEFEEIYIHYLNFEEVNEA